MAKCKICGKKGLFLKLFEKKACAECYKDYQDAAETEPKRYEDNIAIVDGDAEFAERIAAASRALAAARRLAPFDAAGLDVKMPTPVAAALAKLTDFPNAALRAFVDRELPRAKAASQAAKSAEDKMAPFQALLTSLFEVQPHLEDLGEFEKQAARVREFLDGADLAAALEAAEKEEFKGNSEKAVELYLEALFLARRDAVEDEKQAEQIGFIREKIVSLGGQLPPSER
ncbi:MAG: hypothetical protein Tsb0010_16530 [Parvularculaceae bacterium]